MLVGTAELQGGIMARKSKEETRDQESRAWQLRCQGWTTYRIAAEIGITQSAVWKMLRRVEQRVLAGLKDSVVRMKATQTAQLENLLDEALQAWEKSKEPAQSVTKRTVTGQGDNPTVEETVTQQMKGQCGNPTFLAEARDVLADLRKVWGIDAPTKVAPTTPDGAEAWHIEFTKDEQLQLVTEVLRRLGIPDDSPEPHLPSESMSPDVQPLFGD